METWTMEKSTPSHHSINAIIIFISCKHEYWVSTYRTSKIRCTVWVGRFLWRKTVKKLQGNILLTFICVFTLFFTFLNIPIMYRNVINKNIKKSKKRSGPPVSEAGSKLPVVTAFWSRPLVIPPKESPARAAGAVQTRYRGPGSRGNWRSGWGF